MTLFNLLTLHENHLDCEYVCVHACMCVCMFAHVFLTVKTEVSMLRMPTHLTLLKLATEFYKRH